MKASAALTSCMVLFGPVQADEKKDADKPAKERLVGVWVVTQCESLPKGATVEFTKDGKVQVEVTVDGKTVAHEGTYVSDGATATVTHKGKDGKEVKEKLKIKKLTDTELITEDETGKTGEFAKAR